MGYCPAAGAYVLSARRAGLAVLPRADHAAATPRRHQGSRRRADPREPPAAGGATRLLDQGIERVSANEFNIHRQTVDRILGEPGGAHAHHADHAPRGGRARVTGVQLFGVRRNTLLGRLGMQNGDVLNRINGLDIASPDRALEAYSRLRTSDHLQVSVTRNGRPSTSISTSGDPRSKSTMTRHRTDASLPRRPESLRQPVPLLRFWGALAPWSPSCDHGHGIRAARAGAGPTPKRLPRVLPPARPSPRLNPSLIGQPALAPGAANIPRRSLPWWDSPCQHPYPRPYPPSLTTRCAPAPCGTGDGATRRRPGNARCTYVRGYRPGRGNQHP